MDRVMYDAFSTLRPFFNIPGLDKPYSVSGLLSLDTPNNSTLGNYLDDKSVRPGDDSLYDLL